MFYSISNKNFIKRSIIQKLDNSCVSSSVAHGISILMNRSMSHSFFPSILFIYYNGREEKSMDSGAYIENILKGVQKYGIVPENLFPYKTSNIPTPPPDYLYELSEKFPIHFNFQKFLLDTDTEIKEQYQVLNFIREHLWNGELIIADIKGVGNMDHTILIYGLDEKNKIYLCHDPQVVIRTIPFDKNIFDKKDLYAINCKFPNQIPNFILENESTEKEKNNVKKIVEPNHFETHSLSKKFYYIIIGQNIKASLCASFLRKHYKNRDILFLDTNHQNLVQMNDTINDIKYGSYESFDHSTLKYLYELKHDFDIFSKRTNQKEEILIESLLTDILKPIGLDTKTENLNYQIVYCKKLENIKSCSFQDILKDNVSNANNLKLYHKFLSENFTGLDLSLPYYVVLKIIISPLLSTKKTYVNQYKSFLQKFLPTHDKLKLGTFLMSQPSNDNFIYLHSNYIVKDEQTILLFQGSSYENCYSDKIKISFEKLYDTNHFYPVKQLHFEPILKMDLFFICNEEYDNEIVGNRVYKKNIVKISVYEKEVRKIMSEKPSNICLNIIYDISNYKVLERYCKEKKAQFFLLHSSSFSYPITKLHESEIIQKSFRLDHSIHSLNNNFFGSSDIIEYNFNIVELMIYFLNE